MKWFQLDADMPNDPRVRAVVRVLGVEGLGALVALWCHVAKHGSVPGHAIDSACEPLELDDLREATHLSEEKFEELIRICVRTGHFKREAWEQYRGIVIPAMERRADTYTRRAQRRAPEERQRWAS